MRYTAKRTEPLSSEELAEYSGLGFSEKFARLLYIRGIDTAAKVKDFMDFSLEKLHDPFKLKGMQEAVSRINTAITKKERILIIGDYDCDGICATAIMYKYLLTRYARTKYFLPNRDADGYGLSIELIDKLHKRFDPQLIITVDCGISCPDEIAHAQSLGIDCIVTDHHAIPEKTPDCITVNPKLPNQDYPFDELCGAGVALKLVQALGADINQYIDIATIATVADIVPLVNENRVLVHEGLKRINANSNPAITALAKSCNVFGPIKSQDISYKLGPKINAAGRMGVAKRGLDLLLEKDPKRIDEIISSLGTLNQSRQKITANITDEAEAIILAKGLDRNNIIIVHKENWEGGVLGIVAARLTDKYLKPAVVLSRNGNVWKGSARSIRGIDMVKLMERHAHLLVTYGGHVMAAGLSLEEKNLDQFKESIINTLKTELPTESQDTMFDLHLERGDINARFIKELEMLEPLGCQNPAPVFTTQVLSCSVNTLPNYPRHIRFSSRGESGGYLNFTMFDAAIHTELLALDFPKYILFEFQKNWTSEESTSSNNIKTLAKAIIPHPNDERSFAITLQFALTTGEWPENDELEQIRQNLVVDRNTFVEYYRLLQKFIGTRVNGVYNLYTRVQATDKRINPYQFVFVYSVFRELGIISLDNGVVRSNSSKKVELDQSEIYKRSK
ncbi:MAG: single-stranded-DNA-specific exonuclease RecJ [Firmicutes bacterium]|nr:single-stranded-DNA-specific exonuclease RecJ [Bacillota bacterium]